MAPHANNAKVVTQVYRSLLKETRKLDSAPVAKTLFPISPKMCEVAGLHSQLYTPNGEKYETIVKKMFRDTDKQKLKLESAFEALNRIRTHNAQIKDHLPKITKDHEPLMSALKASQPKDGSYWARAVEVKSKDVKRIVGIRGLDNKKVVSSKVITARETPVDLKAGMGLIAHPLSSAHVDRRVMLVVEKNSHVTTGLVLDMLYSYPLSIGNPMFPEVFWGHEVFNGGYCHVDYTMPPTANVSLLHTLEPPTDSTSKEYTSWLSWMKKGGGVGLGGEETKVDSPSQHHEMLCKPLIPGFTDESSGRVVPTLYYSRVEALPYLASISTGKPRSSLRVYWGCMKWPTSQITTEITTGHWAPVEISPLFFSPFPVNPLAAATGASSSDSSKALHMPPERFPNAEELSQSRESRKKSLGADVTIPQTFPPDQPMCRREALWDQLMYTLGGEYQDLVGSVNPFASPRNSISRVALPSDIPRELENLLGEGRDDDDDDE